MVSSTSKRRRESDPGGAAAESPELNTVYVDTSLGTHLAVLVSSSDTVSDFKKKVAMEHKQCFPEIGEIQVHTVKVKLKANYYHLPDIILVRSAFHGVKKNWFLSVEASNISFCLAIRDSPELGTSSGVRIDMTNMDGDGRGFLSDANRNEILPLALTGGGSEENAPSEMIVGPKVIKPVEETTESPAKKKRKVRHTKDEGRNSGLEGVDAMSRPNGNDGKPNMSNLSVNVSGARNDQFDAEGRLVSEGTNLPSLIETSNLASILDSQNVNSSAIREEDHRFERMIDCGLGEDARHLEVVSVMVPSYSARKMDANGGGGNMSTAGSRRKKKKIQKTAAHIQDMLDVEHIEKGERIKPSTDKMAEGNGLSLEDDHEVIKLSNNKDPGHADPDLALDASLLLDAEKSIFTIANSHKLLGSDERKKDNAVEGEMDSKLGQDVPTMQAEGVCTNIPDFSAALVDAGAGNRDVNIDVKKKKNKVKRNAKVKDTREMELIGNDEIKNPHETIGSKENCVSLSSDEWKKDNTVESKIDSKLDLDVPTVHEQQGVCTSIPDFPAASMDASAGSRDVNTDVKRKKRKVKRTTEVKDIKETEQTGNDEIKIPHETIRPEENGVSLGSDEWKKDNALESKMDSELDQDVPTMHAQQGVCTSIPDFPAASMDASAGSRDVSTDVKRKKRKVKRTTEVKDIKEIEQTGNDEIKIPHETIRPEENGVSLGSDEWKKENALESKMDSELDQDVPTMHAEGVCTKLPESSAASMDAGAGSRDVNTDVNKEENKVKRTAEVKDIREMEQTGNDEIKIPHETIRPEENGVSLGSDEWKKDNTLESKMDSELDQDVPTMHAEGACTDLLEFSAALMDGGSGSGDVNTDVKRKKKRVKRTAKIKDTRDMENIGNNEMKNIHETISFEENGVSLGHDNEVTPPSASKALDHVYPDLAVKEASIIRDVDNVMEPQIASCIKGNKRKWQKKLVCVNMGNLAIADIPSTRGSLDLPSPSDDHILKGTGNETGNEESTGLNGGKGVEMILMDASNHDAQEKIWDVNRREADLVESQTEQALEDVNIRNEMMTEKPISSAGDCHADFPSAETENTIMESNHADKDKENTGNRHKKSKKKKRRHTTNCVQENLPVEDPQVGSELEATKQTSFFANSELEGRCLDSSQVLSRKSEEKVDEKHEIVLNTDGHAENSGKSGEVINFKQYFVADQLQNEVDSSDKVINATMSQRSSTKVESNDFPSGNIPTELQNSIKSFENKKPESDSLRGDTVRTMYDSVHSSDRDETSPYSLTKSLETTEKEVKDSSPELCEMASQKPSNIETAPSFQNKIPSLDKSSSERSETLHNNVGNERPLLGSNATFITPMKTPKKKTSGAKPGAIFNNNRGKGRPVLSQNATSLMLRKTPKKKISLAKSGAIFQDDSGESSGDENGTMQSDDSTLSPSDSSSMSGDSAGDSELSQNSVSIGCNDAKEKSSSKFNLSATKDMTMDVILRSSKRFKKAKQVASQNEIEPIKFVPDSQP